MNEIDPYTLVKWILIVLRLVYPGSRQNLRSISDEKNPETGGRQKVPPRKPL